MSIHHIDMNHVRTSLFNRPHLITETAKIGRQNRRRYLLQFNPHISLTTDNLASSQSGIDNVS
jgi:hypothetical protein